DGRRRRPLAGAAALAQIGGVKRTHHLVFGWLYLSGATGLIQEGEAGLCSGDRDAGSKLVARPAQARLPAAEYRVGLCSLQGKGVPPSRSEGRRWLELSATQGFAEAQAALA